MIDVVDRIEPLADEWEDLADRLAASPWMRPGWFAAWADSFGVGDWRIYTVRDDGRLAGVVPLCRARGGLTAPANWHTPQFGLLADGDAGSALAEAVLADRPPSVAMRFVDLASPDMDVWQRTARTHGYRVLVRPVERSPYVDLSQGWEAYEQSLARKLRSEIRRRTRRLGDEGTVEVEVRDGSESLDSLLSQGFEIEAAAWKGDRGSAISSQPSTLGFYRSIASWASERGWLRLAFLRVGGRAIAFDFALEDERIHALLKTGFDPGHRRLAPGMLLRHAMISRAFADGLATYDFLGDDEPWKLEWTPAARERSVAQVFAPSFAGRVQYAAHAHGRPLAKRLVAAVRR